jgi:hypothetical protein
VTKRLLYAFCADGLDVSVLGVCNYRTARLSLRFYLIVNQNESEAAGITLQCLLCGSAFRHDVVQGTDRFFQFFLLTQFVLILRGRNVQRRLPQNMQDKSYI